MQSKPNESNKHSEQHGYTKSQYITAAQHHYKQNNTQKKKEKFHKNIDISRAKILNYSKKIRHQSPACYTQTLEPI